LKINSLYYGELEVVEEVVISFPHGLPGFENHRKFVLLPIKDVGSLYFLQSLAEKDICFTLADPEPFFQDYQPEFSVEDIETLTVKEEDELQAYVILTIPEDFKKSTANLLSPVLINTSRSIGMQIIPAKSVYTTKQLLFTANEAGEQTASAGGK